MIKYFTIMGERCSGTNFLEQAILKNFDIELIWHYGYKHFFGFYDFNTKNPIISNDDEVLFLSIVREPISWLHSFYQKKYHIPNKNKENINNFLFNEFFSLDDNNKLINEDLHINTKKKYKNIFELRYIKNNYLINHQKRVKNYLLIRYEDLKYNYEQILSFIEIKFKLKKMNHDFIKINTYKGLGNKLFIEKNLNFSQKIKNIIKKNINYEQEKSLGYI